MDKHLLWPALGAVAANAAPRGKIRTKANSASRRFVQLLARDTAPKDLLWLGYVLGVAPWSHRAARPLHEIMRWKVARARQSHVDGRIKELRERVAHRDIEETGYRISLARLCPALDDICRPIRRAGQEILLARIDQDGFLCPQFDHLWSAPRVTADAFLPRNRFELAVVDHDGWVGVRKDFRGDKAAFANELEASLDLAEAGCPVPPVFRVDFDRLSITFAYIDGIVVREALAQAGAPMRDRDRSPGQTQRDNDRIYRERCLAGRALVDQVVGHESIGRIRDALLAIHRAGYALGDVKYGNIIIEAATKTPYFVDCERALPLRDFSASSATALRDRDADTLNQLFGTDLLTAKGLRHMPFPEQENLYSPLYAGYGLRWGAIWNPDLGVLRWRHMLANELPIPRGGRVLDLGANCGFNALQMLRAGAKEAVAVEIDPMAINQGSFVKRLFEWADNADYRLSYVQGSHGEVGSMNLGRFDLVTAFCTLYYLSAAAMTKTVRDLSSITDTLVLQCNTDHSIERADPETFMKASLAFNLELLRHNGFPNIKVVDRRGSNRPLLIARTG
jgi:tRNA A-37 threonylcarbamoyl transferase component Bud32